MAKQDEYLCKGFLIDSQFYCLDPDKTKGGLIKPYISVRSTTISDACINGVHPSQCDVCPMSKVNRLTQNNVDEGGLKESTTSPKTYSLLDQSKIKDFTKVECYRPSIFEKCKKFKVSERKYLDDAYHCKVTDCADAPSTYYCRESSDGDGYYFSVHNKVQECVTEDALRAQADALRAKLAAAKLAANQKETIEVP